MGNIFAGSEVVELGIEIEKNGKDFYNALSGKSQNRKAAELFKFLAGEEEKHIKAFEGILAKSEKYEPQGLDADDYFSYMSSLAKDYIFTQKNKGAGIGNAAKNDRDAIELGIGFEKDSIVFYEGIKKVVADSDQRIIDELIAQEEAHLQKLTEMQQLL